MESGRVSLCALDGLSVDSVTSMAHVNRDGPGRRARSDADGGAAGPDREAGYAGLEPPAR
jgi:hypothetical protein